MSKSSIIIIGGGAAGLMAAKELAADHDVLLLEAATRLGGRIHSTIAQPSTQVVEGGAEFIHGHLPLTLELLTQAKIDYVPVAGEMYRKEKGAWKEQHDIIEGWDTLIKKMKDMPEEMTLYDFMQQYYPDQKHTALRKHITNFAEGFDVADIHKVSVRGLYKEWSHQEEENFRIPTGYQSLIHFLQQECEKLGVRILTNHRVKRLYWEKNLVTAYTEDGERFDAQKAIVAIPLMALRNPLSLTAIRFIPAIDQYMRAANQVGVGAVLKVVLQFEKAFWQKDAGFIFGDEVFPTWWTQLPNPAPTLTGWIGGPRVSQFKGLTEKQIQYKALRSLCSIFDTPVEDLEKNLQQTSIFNWEQEGAYSYPLPQTPVARKLLNRPLENTLFFAGEGLYDGDAQGTVEAALCSGKEAVGKIKNVEL